MSNRRMGPVFKFSESHALGIQMKVKHALRNPHPQRSHWSKFEFQARDFPGPVRLSGHSIIAERLSV